MLGGILSDAAAAGNEDPNSGWTADAGWECESRRCGADSGYRLDGDGVRGATLRTFLERHLRYDGNFVAELHRAGAVLQLLLRQPDAVCESGNKQLEH